MFKIFVFIIGVATFAVANPNLTADFESAVKNIMGLVTNPMINYAAIAGGMIFLRRAIRSSQEKFLKTWGKCPGFKTFTIPQPIKWDGSWKHIVSDTIRYYRENKPRRVALALQKEIRSTSVDRIIEIKVD